MYPAEAQGEGEGEVPSGEDEALAIESEHCQDSFKVLQEKGLIP